MKDLNTNNQSETANQPFVGKSGVKQNPEEFTRFQYEAMKHREIDLTELPHSQRFIETLKANNPDGQDSGIICRLSYDATIKTCCLTGSRFFPPVPLAFFQNGDRTKPVDPTKALNGFTMERMTLWAICRCLSTDENLYHWLPRAYKSADWNDLGWLDDYAGFHWEPGEVIDDYYYLQLNRLEPLLEMKRRGEPIEWINEPQNKKENPDQLLFDFVNPTLGVSVDEALQFLRKPAAPETASISSTVTETGVCFGLKPTSKAA